MQEALNQDHAPIQHNWSVRGLHVPLDSLLVVDRWARMCHGTTTSSSSPSALLWCASAVKQQAIICNTQRNNSRTGWSPSLSSTFLVLGGNRWQQHIPVNSFHCAVFALLTDVWINEVTTDHVNKWSMVEHLELTRWGSCSNYFVHCMNAFSYDRNLANNYY